MIAKCKAVSHGKALLEYAMRERKMDKLLVKNLVSGTTPAEILSEFEAVNRYNSRCKNKYLRFEIGIAPKDKAGLSAADLRKITVLFAKKLGLENHQWVACTHKDTGNLHIHLIANRIGIDGAVYQTDFVSNRSAKAAEEISRELGLTIAKEVRAEKQYVNPKMSPDRQAAKEQLQKIAYETLPKCKSPKEFVESLARQGVKIEFARNKQNKIYGMRFGYGGFVFKASEVGREFGLRTLYNQYGFRAEDQKVISSVPKYKPISGMATNITSTVAKNTINTISEAASAIGGLFDLQPSSSDYDPDQAEYLRQQLQEKKKKKRGIRM